MREVAKIRRLLPPNLRKKLPKEIRVVQISRAESKKLNLRFRKKNRPTNVLSFRYHKDYGEILICPEIVRKESKAAGNSYFYQVTWMILHGMLHLAEIHHERSKTAARRAEKLEAKLLAKILKIVF